MRKSDLLKLQFFNFKLVSRSVFRELQLVQISLNFTNLVATLKSEVWAQNCEWFFYYFYFWKELWRFKSGRVHEFSWTKIQALIKTRRNRKWKIPHTASERWTLRFISHKNCELKVKRWWVGARERKKGAFFVKFIFSEGFFFISMHSVLNKLSEYVYTFTECAKFHGSCSIVPLWVFRGSKIFLHGSFVSPKFFQVSISWVQIFFSWVFRGSKIFSLV